MKLTHTIKVTLFVKPSDDTPIDLYKAIYDKLCPIDHEKERTYINIEEASGLDGKKIQIIVLELSKESHTNLFIKQLKSLIGQEACRILIEQKESRLDDELHFYIRLDRASTLKDEFALTDGGDCIHIKLTLAAFPKNKQTALKLAEKIFG